ncbi:hypothetical protein [Priestia megaterium]|uniref:hypothetical protein n=1 Tax=Priestia megaterium TaxID=1404 RepID=UPI00077D9047|nr:hypothetical protein [Priestia megaterium]
MKLVCKSCEIEISNVLTELRDLSLLNKEIGEDHTPSDYIPQGYFLIVGEDDEVDKKGTIIINLKDLINSKHHPDDHRLNGCCGLDGLDGMNRVCLNGHEIGTENSDCWMPHYIAINPSLVKFI